VRRPTRYDDATADVLEDYLRSVARGKANARTGARIVQALRPTIPSLQKLRDYVEYLRRHRRLLIAADTTRGYYICATVPEFRAFYRSYRGRAMEMLMTCSALSDAYPALLTDTLDFEEDGDG
jgi:hypothetical protein